jgi:hypothetical protein
MAYELFDELSTCDLEEIAHEDLEKIIEDCQFELNRRKREVKREAVCKFKEAFENLVEAGVSIDFTFYSPFSDEGVRTFPLVDIEDFTFKY